MNATTKLSSGDEMPLIGLGLWKIDRADAARAVREALRSGYRHLDSACDYGNEAEVGEGIRQAIEEGICRREELWVTSKLWNTYHAKEHVRPAVERSLRDLGLDHLDLYMIHFPIAMEYVPFEKQYPPGWISDHAHPERGMKLAKVPGHEVWEAMEELVQAGLVRNIGICNYNTALLRDLLCYAKIRPAVLQVELHPYLTQEKLLRFCHEEGIAVTGFSPLGAPSYVPLGAATLEESVMEEDVVRDVAQRHGKTPAQVVLRWGVQRGTSIVPKTSKFERMIENRSIFDFELTDDEMRSITALNRNRRFNDPGVFCEAAFHTFCPIYE
ncbi:aldo/keto reductase [Singulisphaera sp. Ch08]|uniref:Aldo/keto reductase n=1 Tax=Singulisphaera sp. Ch08 TaxID=3120278 RepID=A0AAU7CE02_9BACT